MMKKKRPMYRRIMAMMLAIVLVGILLFITNSLTGNPISAHFAGREMRKYVKEKYPDMNLNFTKAKYNFKYAGYTLDTIDPHSPDTHFMVVRRSDGYIHDGYENYVLSGFNTLDRLGKEMTQEIEPLLKNLFGSELSGRCFADCFGENKDLTKAPALDTPFNRDMELNASIFLDFDIENPTLEDIAEKLKKADRLLKSEGFSVGEYIIQALNRNTKTGYMVQVEREMIQENLLEAMKNACNNDEYNDRLSVYSMK